MHLKKSYSWLVMFVALVLVLSACGGAPAASPTAAPAAEPTKPAAAEATAAPAAEATAEPAMEEPTAAPVMEEPTATGVISFDQEPKAGQEVIVWMVRTGLAENRWQHDVVMPAWNASEMGQKIFVNVLSINQDDIAVKREAMIAAKEPLHVWSPNWGGDGFASDRFRGLMADLNPLIERDKYDTSDYIPEVLKIYNMEGKQWSLPFLTTGTYVYYNMKLFDEAGIPYPPSDWNDKSWTWDAFLDTAKKLTKITEDPAGSTYGANNGIWPPFDGLPLIWGLDPWTPEALQTGFSEPITINTPEYAKAFQTIHDMVYVEKVAPDSASADALNQLGGAFQSGRIAMNITGGWGHWVFKDLINDPNGFCWGAAPIPWGTENANVRATIFTDPWAITAGMDQKNTDNAWEFLKFLTLPEQQKSYSDVSGAPPVRTSLLNDYYKLYEKCVPVEKTKESFSGAFSHGRESSNHLLVRYDELSQTWDNLLSPYWSDPEAQATDLLPQMEADVNAAIERINAEDKE